jgi:signal transduction histidine kinase
MQHLRRALKRYSGTSWCTTAGLALLTLLISHLIDGCFTAAVGLKNPPWSVLPVLAGVALLNATQESLLVVLFLALEISCDLAHGVDHADGQVEALLWARRSLFLVGCIWAAHVRSRLVEQRRELETSQAALGGKLAQSLKASALAHELRQPLSQLLLQTRLMQHRFEEEPITSPALQQTMADLQTCGCQINTLIAAMGSLLNEKAPPPQRVNLTTVLRSCLRRLQPLLQASRVEVQLHLMQPPVLVKGQPEQLEIACCNLLSNACEALEQQPQPRRLACHLTADDGWVELVVADSGPGLPSTNLRDLLMSSNKPHGMGVGLLTVQSIACRHGGVLQLGCSKPLGGAELHLRLPLANPHAN